MEHNESVEDYLEAILIISKRLPVVRSIDIVDELGYKKSSISIAMKNLREKGLIDVREHGYIYLTEEGLKVANMIYERHQFLSDFFISQGIPEDIAVKDACRMEHDLSPATFEVLKKFIETHRRHQ